MFMSPQVCASCMHACNYGGVCVSIMLSAYVLMHVITYMYVRACWQDMLMLGSYDGAAGAIPVEYLTNPKHSVFEAWIKRNPTTTSNLPSSPKPSQWRDKSIRWIKRYRAAHGCARSYSDWASLSKFAQDHMLAKVSACYHAQ